MLRQRQTLGHHIDAVEPLYEAKEGKSFWSGGDRPSVLLFAQPSKPNIAKPQANNGKVAGNGVSVLSIRPMT